MLIDFSALSEERLPHFCGGEKELAARFFKDDQNQIFLGRLTPGASIGMHRHETSSEILYILDGTGTVFYDETSSSISAGICHYCPKGHSHSLLNSGDADLVFIAVVPQQ